MAYTRRLIIVVDGAVRGTTNSHAQSVDVVGGDRTFTVGLAPALAPAGTPPTHYICNWAMTPSEGAAMRGRLAALISLGRVRVFDGNQVTHQEVLTALSLRELERPS